MSPHSIWYLIKYRIPPGSLDSHWPGLLVRPPAPGEQIVLSLCPLGHISNLIIDVYYILSVAGTSVFPGYDVLRVNKDKELWELFAEVRVCRWLSFSPQPRLDRAGEIRNVISRTSGNNADSSVSFCQWVHCHLLIVFLTKPITIMFYILEIWSSTRPALPGPDWRGVKINVCVNCFRSTQHYSTGQPPSTRRFTTASSPSTRRRRAWRSSWSTGPTTPSGRGSPPRNLKESWPIFQLLLRKIQFAKNLRYAKR